MMSWDDDGDSPGGKYGEYVCVNAGCIYGTGHVFRAAPPEWFERKDLSTPVNCPDCNSWKAEQERIGPIMAVCCLCGYQWPIHYTYRIIYHRQIGNWDAYWAENALMQICKKCEETPGRRRKLICRTLELRERRAREAGVSFRQPGKTVREREGDVKLNDLFDLVRAKGIGQTNTYNVPYDPAYYQRILDPEHGTALNHIMSSKHEWLQNIGTQAPNVVMDMAYRISLSTEPHVLEFKAGNRIMKYDTNQRVCVLIEGDRRSPTQNRILTTYPRRLESVINKIDTGEWKCS